MASHWREWAIECTWVMRWAATSISGVTMASLNWSNIRSNRFQLSAGVKETVIGAFFFGVFWNLSEVISQELNLRLNTPLRQLFCPRGKGGSKWNRPSLSSLIELVLPAQLDFDDCDF